MKYSFLSSKTSILILGLILGSLAGFKIANSQYRHTREKVLTSRVRAASATIKGELTTEQQAFVDKANKSPQDIGAQLDAASAMMQIMRLDDAVKYFDQANKLAPDHPETLRGLAMANLIREDWSEVLRYSMRYIELNHPENDGVSFSLAVAYIETKQKLDDADRILSKIEQNGQFNEDMIGKARAGLKAALEQVKPGTNANPKSVLNHGPEEPKK